MKSTKFFLSSLIFFVMLIGMFISANAALVDNGDGTITDTDTNLMWLQDANLAGSLMLWSQAMTWADTLNYAGYTDWKLPTTLLPDSSCGTPATSTGYNCSGSEMGHLNYLHGIAWTNPGPFSMPPGGFYWSSTEKDTDEAYHFSFTELPSDPNGLQKPYNKVSNNYAWAVRVVPQSIHPYDKNQDWAIGDFELLDSIDVWAQGHLGDFELLDLIDYWAAGCYKWDDISSKWKICSINVTACFTVNPLPSTQELSYEIWDASCSTGVGLSYRWEFSMPDFGYEWCYGADAVIIDPDDPWAYAWPYECSLPFSYNPNLARLPFDMTGFAGYRYVVTLIVQDPNGDTDSITATYILQ
jgi:hypothetical protein